MVLSSPRLRPDEEARPGGTNTSNNTPSALRRFFSREMLRANMTSNLVIPIRVPALMLLSYSLWNTYLYNQAKKSFDRGETRFATTRGKLLSIQKNNYFYNAVPRYCVRYEYTVDGVRYESRRATTGSFYRDWIPFIDRFYNDTITESQYLQAFPILRQNEPCTVFYDKKSPRYHSALASDANSAESGVALYLAVFPLIFANMLMATFMRMKRSWKPPVKRIRMPKYDIEHAKAQQEGKH